jgi:hypothetical protein
MAFAHLGIGKFCHMVRNYVPHNDSVVEAERILQMDALRDLEHRLIDKTGSSSGLK